MEVFSRLPILAWLDPSMSLLRKPERAAAKRKENTQPWLSRDGTVHRSCYYNFVGTHQPLTCGELGKLVMLCFFASMLYILVLLLIVAGVYLVRCSRESRFYPETVI